MMRFVSWGAALLVAVWALGEKTAKAADRPNILWLTSEDHGPHMGCYGDAYASTPHIDALAAKGLRYRRAWSNAPVCAPARTTLIAGMYACSTGGEHMRSHVAFPSGKQMFPQLLRAAGYYCTNNSKEDYNLSKPGKVWDESSHRAHWKNRGRGQPFFAVFNSTSSHESQIRKRPHIAVHDPREVRIPAYHPDVEDVRRDWAQYYDMVSQADAEAGARLKELGEAGLEEETIVFYFADHGSGMPRNKRWPYNCGLHVPLVVYIPEKFKELRPEEYQPGAASDRLVSFVDFAPTVLSLAGVEPPDWMQGTAFLGRYAGPPARYLFGFRARMDERMDLVRSVTDGRFVYVRNYMPHEIQGQHLAYMFQTPTTRAWHALHEQGKLNPAQDAFWRTKSPEELYDLSADQDEVQNLAGSADHEAKLKELRAAHKDWTLAIRDLGYLPEGELHDRSQGTNPYDMAREESKYPLERIFAAADLASRLDPAAAERLKELVGDPASAVRYWAALGLLMRGETGVRAGADEWKRALADPSPYVQVVAAEALARHGAAAEREEGLRLLERRAREHSKNVFGAIDALNALDNLGDAGAAVKASLRSRFRPGKPPHPRYADYVPRLLAPIE